MSNQEEAYAVFSSPRSQRWDRYFREKSRPYMDNQIGATLTPAQEIEDLHDYVRFLEITNRSPFPVYQLACTVPADHLFLNDNVFFYDNDTGVTTPPINFNDAYKQSEGFNGLKVGMVMSWVEAEEPNRMKPGETHMWTFSAIVIDEANNVVHRIDPDRRPKPGLDDAIAGALTNAGCNCEYIAPASENNGKGPAYWDVNFYTSTAITSPEFVTYKQGCFWHLNVRLAFADVQHNAVFREYVNRFNQLNDKEVEQLVMNWYVDFTNDANLHAFGDALYLPDHQEIEYMPCYTQFMNSWIRRMSYDNKVDDHNDDGAEYPESCGDSTVSLDEQNVATAQA